MLNDYTLGMEIRSLSSASLELAELQSLCAQLGYAVSVPELSHRIKILQASGNDAVFVSEDDQKISGFIHLQKTTALIREERVEIKALVVNENFRGQGIGKALVKAGIEWARSFNTPTIFLSCNILREQTHIFYQNLGFEHKKTSKIFEMKI